MDDLLFPSTELSNQSSFYLSRFTFFFFSHLKTPFSFFSHLKTPSDNPEDTSYNPYNPQFSATVRSCNVWIVLTSSQIDNPVILQHSHTLGGGFPIKSIAESMTDILMEFSGLFDFQLIFCGNLVNLIYKICNSVICREILNLEMKSRDKKTHKHPHSL